MYSYILIVEDDNDINKMLNDLLTLNGYRTIQAYSGTEALLHIQKQAPAAVILDLMLPGMDGEELLAQIKAAHEETAVIIASAKEDVSTRISLLHAGADAFAGNLGKNLPVYAALQLIMTGTLAAISVMIGELCRNLAAGIFIGIGVAAFPAMILNMIDLQFAGQNITLSQYWPVTRMASCPFEKMATAIPLALDGRLR
ncbi:MAG: response regulator transcription factor [Eubacterium sp.]|nr:response regulator transcription factor [Eubacterium sp.]